MTELLGLVAVSLLALPVMKLIAELRRASDPHTYFRSVGVVVRRLEALDEASEVIGRYMGTDIFNSVVFKGLRYEFKGVVPPVYKEIMGGSELYLEPGLIYVTR